MLKLEHNEDSKASYSVILQPDTAAISESEAKIYTVCRDGQGTITNTSLSLNFNAM